MKMSEKMVMGELVKALRCCERYDCIGCPFTTVHECSGKMIKQAADTLESLSAERDGLREQLAAALEENTRLAEKVPHWISVKDRLPQVAAELPDYAEDIFIPIIICDEDRDVYPAQFGKESKEFRYEDGGHLMSTVLYWMPLPEPPKAGESNE